MGVFSTLWCVCVCVDGGTYFIVYGMVVVRPPSSHLLPRTFPLTASLFFSPPLLPLPPTGHLITSKCCRSPTLFASYLDSSFGVSSGIASWKLNVMVAGLVLASVLIGAWDACCDRKYEPPSKKFRRMDVTATARLGVKTGTWS